MVILQTVATATGPTPSFAATDVDELYISGQLNPTTITDAGSPFPELGSFFGTWGSISSGELVLIYSEGGAVLFYGDLGAFQSTKLPGVMGTLGCVGRAAPSPAGLIYVTANEGAYIWNGDNNSQKISDVAVPENDLIRFQQGNGFDASPLIQTSLASSGPWVFFPSNWLFDTLTNSWWLTEDPTVINFQVFCAGDPGTYLIVASPGIAYAAAGELAIVNTYAFNKGNPVSSYFWLSNPIPVTTGALVSIEVIEIVASNTTSTPCTITVTPQVPAGQLPLSQQNPNQPIPFTIPPATVGYRAYQRLGYTDYNVELGVTATNSNVNNAAPILHSITIGYMSTRSSGVQ
jgi:hypothetical protein